MRDWLHVDDHARALLDIITKGRIGEKYNIGSNNQLKNIEIVKTICNILDDLEIDKPPGVKSFRDLITFVKDRPGHDLKYGINPTKISKDLKWIPNIKFEAGIKETVKWYVKNKNHYF